MICMFQMNVPCGTAGMRTNENRLESEDDADECVARGSIDEHMHRSDHLKTRRRCQDKTGGRYQERSSDMWEIDHFLEQIFEVDIG